MNDKSFFQKDYSCPVCYTNLKSLTVRSSAAVTTVREPDFHVVYSDVSPLHYSIIVCPTCCYAASSGTFNDPLPPKSLEGIARALHALHRENYDFTGERTVAEALKSWQLAIQTAQLKKTTPGQLAGLFLGAAWMSRELEEAELETSYMTEAVTAYISGYNNEHMPLGNLDEISVAYLIGELSRRLGMHAQALNWFGQVLRHPEVKKKPLIEKMAREQWRISREEYAALNPGGVPADGSNGVPDADFLGDEPPKRVVASTRSAAKTRKKMQMSVGLYNDQIDWLNKVVNSGYSHSKVLVTKEEVLRAVIDCAMEMMNEAGLPETFSTEMELTAALKEKLRAKEE